MLFGLDAVLAGLLASLRLGWPSGAMSGGHRKPGFCLPLRAAWIGGNIFSVRMPIRINPGRIARQRGSQANTLSSVLVQAGIMIVGAAGLPDLLASWRSVARRPGISRRLAVFAVLLRLRRARPSGLTRQSALRVACWLR